MVIILIIILIIIFCSNKLEKFSDTKKQKIDQSCTPGKNQCEDKLFCATDNKDYYYKESANTCKERKKDCDPTYEQTNGKKGEKSCNDGFSCVIDGEYYKCLTDKNRKKGDSCTPGKYQCSDGLFCPTDNDKYYYNESSNKCRKKKKYCDPTFTLTDGKKGEKSCKDDDLCLQVNDYYMCIKNKNRSKNDPCNPGKNQCKNNLFCATDNTEYYYKEYANTCREKINDCDPTYEQTNGKKGEKSCNAGFSCKLENKSYKCIKN